VLVFLASSAALADTRTTQPGKTVLVYFVFTDTKLLYGIYREGPGGPTDLYLGSYPARGDYAHFFLINRGKKTQSFDFMKRAFTVRPGRRIEFSQALLYRGAFPYWSPSDRGSGVFRVS
jgi:hypothetical protein